MPRRTSRRLRPNSRRRSSRRVRPNSFEAARIKRQREYDRARKAQLTEISRFAEEAKAKMSRDMGVHEFYVYYSPGRLEPVREGDLPPSGMSLALPTPIPQNLDKIRLAAHLENSLARVSWHGPDMIPQEIREAPATERLPAMVEYRTFQIEKVEPAVGKAYYSLHYPEGGEKQFGTMKAARKYVDEYMGD